MIPTGFRGRAGRATLPGFEAAGRAAGVELAALLAVWSVECAGSPFLADGRPAILFEAHIFSRLTGGVHDRAHPSLSAQRWDRTLYARTRAGEYARLEAAMRLARDAALMAASWGGPQILGSNHRLAGYASVDAMVAAFCETEGAHIGGFLSFVRARGLVAPLAARDWKAFARGYNGTAYAANAYDTKLATAYAREAGALADGVVGPGDRGTAVETVQRMLVAAGQDIAIDGAFGRMSALAVERVQTRAGLPPTGLADASTIAALQSMALVA